MRNADREWGGGGGGRSVSLINHLSLETKEEEVVILPKLHTKLQLIIVKRDGVIMKYEVLEIQILLLLHIIY